MCYARIDETARGASKRLFNFRGSEKRPNKKVMLTNDILILGIHEKYVRAGSDPANQLLDESSAAPPTEQ